MPEREDLQTQSRLSRHTPFPTALVIALPVAVVAVNVVVWSVAASRSGFWADDFLNLTSFYHSLGHLSDTQINTGKYIINLYWALGTEAFGTSAVLPYLLLDTAVLAAGLIIWLRVGTNVHWTATDAWWIGGLFIATAAWYPTTLWASNITHAGGYLALGVAFWAHQRCLAASTRRRALVWSVFCGLAWLGAVVSNLLYVGLLVIAAYCAFHQVLKLRRFEISTRLASVAVAGSNLVLPLIYFFAVAYPATTAHGPYTSNGFSFIHKNFLFYEAYFAGLTQVKVLYIVIAVLCIVGAVSALRSGDYFPLAVFGAALATAIPALVQGQQQELNYVEMPLLLTFTSLVAGLRSMARRRGYGDRRWPEAAGILVAAVVLVLLFTQASSIRVPSEETPLGGMLTAFRSQVARLTPSGAFICARLNFDAATRNTFIAEMEGPDGFQVPPIDAAGAVLVAPGQPCPAGSVGITVNPAQRGGWTASTST